MDKNQDLTEIITRFIIENGGKKEDIVFFTEEMAREIGRTLARKGVESRQPKSFSVYPVNKISDVVDHIDWMPEWLTDEHSPLSLYPHQPKDLQIIKCEPGQIDDILSEMDNRGFIPAPANYLLGLGVVYPEVYQAYRYIISLDKRYSGFTKYHFFLNLRFQKSKRELRMAKYQDGIDGTNHWFAVIKK